MCKERFSRREFFCAAATSIPSLALGKAALGPMRHATDASHNIASGTTAEKRPLTLWNNRFLALATVVRVNQIEATRTRSIGQDETALNTPGAVEAFRRAFAAGWPGGRLTWALSWLALNDPSDQYKAIRKLVAEYHALYGDAVTFIPGGYFANVYNTREQVNRDLHDGLALASAVVGQAYRPECVIAGFLAAENLRFLAEKEDVHVCQGNIWSQYGIDKLDDDGSICYPYYPSQQDSLKPAQSRADFIDCVDLDGWSCDFLAARRPGFAAGFNSRMGVGPIETIHRYGLKEGLREMLHTTAIHFDTGFDLNGFAWVTNIWEVSIGAYGLAEWLSAVRRRWPDACCITHGEFGLLWRRPFRNNSRLNYRFIERGSGIGGSDADKEIRWLMNDEFRLALLHQIPHGPESVIDFTRYDLSAHEPQGLARDWCLMGEINQKETRPQDAPRAFEKLSAGDQKLILQKYPSLAHRMAPKASG
jgi:hypothetical protein